MKKYLFSLVFLLSANLVKAEKKAECVNNSTECITTSITPCTSEMTVCNSSCPEKNCTTNLDVTCDPSCDTKCQLIGCENNETTTMCCETSTVDMTEMASMQMCMMQAVTTNDLDLVQEMVNAGVNVNCCDENGKTPLMCAVDMGHLNMYKYLISQGADVFMRDKAGNSVLFYACSKTRCCDMEIDHQKICDHQEIILSLLEIGIDF